MVHMGYFKYNDAWIGWCPDGQGVVHPQGAAWQYGSGSVIRVWLPGPERTIIDKNLHVGSGDSTKWIVIKMTAKEFDEHGAMEVEMKPGYSIPIVGTCQPKY